MKQITRFSFLMTIVFLFCWAGTGKKDGTVEQAFEKADKLIKIPYSNFYIIPPAGFAVDKLSNQLQKHSEKSYSPNFVPMTIFTGMTAEKYTSDVKATSEKKYPGVWKEESLTVSGVPAKICRYQAFSGVKVYHLYFTGKWKDQLLIANYDEKDEATGNAMYEALKTVVIKDK